MALTLAVPSGSTAASRADNEQPASAAAARARAEAFVERGARAYEIGDYEAALSAFQDAAATYASPDFHFNIGLCHERLGELGEAARSFEAYLRSKPDASDRASVERRVDHLRATMSAADDDVARMDVAPMLRQPRSTETSAHELVRTTGSHRDVVPVRRTERHPGRAATATGATLFGVGTGLAVGGGVAFDILARRRTDRVDDVLARGNPQGSTYAQTREMAREADRFRGLQIGAIAVGVTLAAVAIGLLVVGRRRARAAATRSHVAFDQRGIATGVRIVW